MTKTKPLIILLTLILLPTSSMARQIQFEYKNSLRIPYHSVKIRITEKEDIINLSVVSSTGMEESKWKNTEKNYSLEISKESFENIYSSIVTFYKSYIPSNTKYSILDGSIWTLRFGSRADKVQISSRSPDHDTEKRNLKELIRIGESIVKMSELPVKEVLYD